MMQGQCPQCGMARNRGAWFCGRCGHAFSTARRAKWLPRAEVVAPLIHVAPPRFLVRALRPGEDVLASLWGAALPQTSASRAMPAWLLATHARLLYGGSKRLARPWVAELAYQHIRAWGPWQGAPTPHIALHGDDVTLTAPLRDAEDAAFIARLITGAKAGILFLPPAQAAGADTTLPGPRPSAPILAALPSVAPTVPLTPNALDVRALAEATRQLLVCLGLLIRLTQDGPDGIDMEALDPHPLRGGIILVRCRADGDVVGRSQVQELEIAVRRMGAMKGIFVSNGRFAPDARALARDKPLALIEHAELDTLLAEHGHGSGNPDAAHLTPTIKLRT